MNRRRTTVALAAFVICAPAAHALGLETFRPRLASSDSLALDALVDSLSSAWEANVGALDLADSLLALSGFLLDADDLNRARSLAERALELRVSTVGADSPAAAQAHGEIMVLAFQLGDLDAAWLHQSQVVHIARASSEPPEVVGDALVDLAFIAHSRSAYADAERLWLEAGSAHSEAMEPNHRLIAVTESSRAEALRMLGRFDAAESLMVSAIARSERHLERGSDHAKLLNNLGALYWNRDRLADAERLYRESLRIRESGDSPDSSAIATACQNLGVLVRDQGDLNEAERLFTRAMELARAGFAEDDPDFAYFPLELGTIYALTDRPEQALALWEEALDVLGRSPRPHPVFEAKILADIGVVYLEQGELHRAAELVSRARSLRVAVLGPEHPDVAVCDLALARVAEERGDRDLARRLVTSSLQTLNGTDLAREARIEALALDARILLDLGERTAALDRMEAATDLLDGLRSIRGGGDLARARLVEKYLDYYETAIAWAVDDGRLDVALRFAEQARARVLQDRLNAAGIDLAHDVPADLRGPLMSREREARARVSSARGDLRRASAALNANGEGAAGRVATLEKELGAAIRAYADVDSEIRLHSPSWSTALLKSAGLDALEEVQDALEDAEALWLYEIGDHRSFVFVVRPNDPVSAHELPVTEPGLADLLAEIGSDGGNDGLIAALRGVTGMARVDREGAPERADDAEYGGACGKLHALWRKLIPASAWSAARRLETVTIIPDGSLHALPFEALVTTACAGPEPVYWLDDGPVIRYAHSIATWLELRRSRDRGHRQIDNVLTLADPAYARADAGATGAAVRGEFDQLPGTRRESDAIEAAFGSDRVTVLAGSLATEDALKRNAPRAGVLHLATHGVVGGERNELLAALVLAEPKEGNEVEDGFLHLFEVYELGLDCELAVLSACDTKLGERVAGEGVFALSRGFIAAGARRTVASLWAVNDLATATLMESFVRRIAEDERSGRPIRYAAHLRDAKRELRADGRWSAPYYWAPFVMTGLP